MGNKMTKNGFFKRLNLLLMFNFNDTERPSIIADYQEGFECQLQQGKTEIEICNKLENPINIVKNLNAENKKRGFGNRSIVFRLIFFVVAVFLIHLLTSIPFRQNGMNYFGFAFVYNIVIVLAGIPVFGMKKVSKEFKSIKHFILFGSMMLLLVLWMVIAPILTYVRVGEICSTICCILLIILFIISMYFIVQGFEKNMNDVFVFVVNIFGAVSAIMNIICSLNIFSKDIAAFKQHLLGSVILYIEMLIVCVLFYLRGKFNQNEE